MHRLRQALPAARIIPNLSVQKNAPQEAQDKRKDWEDRLTALASKAYQRQHGKFEEGEAEPLAVINAPVQALAAASFYVSEKAYETKLPHFRKALKQAKVLSERGGV
jgi:hypothetical protein